MSHDLSTEQFVKAIQSDQGLTIAPTASGFVRKTPDAAVIEFSPSFSLCAIWVRIPVKMIDKVKLLGKRQCLDHLHDYVILYFKHPESSEAGVFAQLLQHAVSAPLTSMTSGADATATALDEVEMLDTTLAGECCARVWIYTLGGGLQEAYKKTHPSCPAAIADARRMGQFFQRQGFRVKIAATSGSC
jgi:hypothetical protein